MPLYEYVCQDCGARFDALRSIQDADKPITCKSCLSERTSRQLSIFFASRSAERSSVGSSSSASGCAGCSGGSCASCGH